MPLFSIDIEKVYGETWTNRYICEADDLASATSLSSVYLGAEAAIHSNIVTISRARISSMAEGDDAYQIVQVNTQGSRNTTGETLPLWNVVRVDFTAIGGGRPSRKYLRLPIYEGDQASGALGNTIMSLVETSYVTPLIAPSAMYRDVDGQSFASGQVFPRVAMRQLRRGSRRRTTPVLG